MLKQINPLPPPRPLESSLLLLLLDSCKGECHTGTQASVLSYNLPLLHCNHAYLSNWWVMRISPLISINSFENVKLYAFRAQAWQPGHLGSTASPDADALWDTEQMISLVCPSVSPACKMAIMIPTELSRGGKQDAFTFTKCFEISW